MVFLLPLSITLQENTTAGKFPQENIYLLPFPNSKEDYVSEISYTRKRKLEFYVQVQT